MNDKTEPEAVDHPEDAVPALHDDVDENPDELVGEEVEADFELDEEEDSE